MNESVTIEMQLPSLMNGVAQVLPVDVDAGDVVCVSILGGLLPAMHAWLQEHGFELVYWRQDPAIPAGRRAEQPEGLQFLVLPKKELIETARARG